MKSARIAAGLVLPFVVLEIVNGGGFTINFPVVLFVVLWGLAAVFLLVAKSLVPRLQTDRKLALSGLRLLPRLVLLAAIAWMWVGIVADQMPCFLGVPNCD